MLCDPTLDLKNGTAATKGKTMTQLLMPKATAVWLIDNSALTFEQIGTFCNLHPLEVQSMADGEAGIGIQGYDPIINGQITRAELDR